MTSSIDTLYRYTILRLYSTSTAPVAAAHGFPRMRSRVVAVVLQAAARGPSQKRLPLPVRTQKNGNFSRLSNKRQSVEVLRHCLLCLRLVAPWVFECSRLIVAVLLKCLSTNLRPRLRSAQSRASPDGDTKGHAAALPVTEANPRGSSTSGHPDDGPECAPQGHARPCEKSSNQTCCPDPRCDE